jgi:hypothetical protein
MELLQLETDNGELIIDSLCKLVEIFTNKKIISEVYEFSDVINHIFELKKVNLRKTNKLTSAKFSFTENKPKEVFGSIDNETFENLLSIYKYHKPAQDFSVIQAEGCHSNIDLLDFILFLYNYKQPSNALLSSTKEEQETIKEENRLTDSISHIALTIYSAMNLEISGLGKKPNCYFILSLGEDYFVSEPIIKTSHPAWNKKIDIKFNSDLILTKINNNIIIQFYSKDDNLFRHNMLCTNSVESFEGLRKTQDDEYIGEIEIKLTDILNLLNENNEFIGYFHIKNNNSNIKGQAKIKIYFEDSILATLTRNNFKVSAGGKQSNNNKDALISSIITNFKMQESFNKSITQSSPKFYNTSNIKPLPKKTYEFEDQFKDFNTEKLWEKLNQNTVNFLIILAHC